MSEAIQVTRAQLEARRAELLKRSHSETYAAFRHRAENGQLCSHEWEIRDELDSIAWLLDDERAAGYPFATPIPCGACGQPIASADEGEQHWAERHPRRTARLKREAQR